MFLWKKTWYFSNKIQHEDWKKVLYCVLNASHHAYVSSVLNLDFLIVNYTNRLFPLLYENSVCST